MNDEPHITFTCNERAVRTLSWAVDYSLAHWSGQGDVDQEMLIGLKHQLHGCMLEFLFDKNTDQ
tara:strand:- start:412 stop:603 length:192 start_codon:yes stop_codon:yes gene_type:complete